MGSSLHNRIKPSIPGWFKYPVGMCPHCKETEVPFSYVTSELGGHYCLNCHMIVEKLVPVGYVSQLDLEETEWVNEL